jgi:hypothetical protein
VIIDEEYLPEIVQQIFSDIDGIEIQNPPTKPPSHNTLPRSSTKKTSQDSGNPPSETSEISKPNTWPREESKSGPKFQDQKKNSPQLEAVRRMDAMRKTGQNTRKYNASVEDEEDTATLIYDRKTKSWKLEMKNAVNAQVNFYSV